MLIKDITAKIPLPKRKEKTDFFAKNWIAKTRHKFENVPCFFIEKVATLL